MAAERAEDFSIVIPARFGSTRLPGKPLRLLAGKPLLQHVWERAREAGASNVVIAADDERILEAARSWGAVALMTSAQHRSGTERLAEVASMLGWGAETIVVNLQGDEPLVPHELPSQAAAALVRHPDVGISTFATRIQSVEELFDTNVVKVVLRGDGAATYFSRAPIPWCRDSFASVPEGLPPGVPFLRHIGLYAYRASVLRRLADAPPSYCEEAESLEQLRALSLGIGIRVEVVSELPGRGVDTEHDLKWVEEHLKGRAP
jgi:3-deoxy-manno-octulosonate cytidylyltransferase (CMP-KDO synthetase)